MKSLQEQKRCSWVNIRNPLYVRYHDEEWGKPVHDDGLLGEMLILESFQAGLSWECVLQKREAFRQALDGFNMAQIACYDAAKIDELLTDVRLIRHRGKLQAQIVNAQAFLAIQKEWGSFNNYLWHWTQGKVLTEHGLTQSPLSSVIAKDLRRRGMKYVGSTTIYAYLQAVGIINGHDVECFLAVQNK